MNSELPQGTSETSGKGEHLAVVPPQPGVEVVSR
jgi:hypothetical protein